MPITKEVVPYYDTGYLHRYEEKFVADGKAILDGAKVRETLQKVVGDMRSQYPDIQVEDQYSAVHTHGVVGIKMTWNHHEEMISGYRRGSFDQLMVVARLATGEVAVSTQDGWQVLGESEQSDPDSLMLAVKNGVDSPLRWGKVLGKVV